MVQHLAYSTGKLSHRFVRNISLVNTAIMLTLFVLSIAALYIFTYQSTYQRIDAELERRLEGFTNSHLSVEQHSERLPSGLLPVIYTFSSTEGYFNLHPTDQIAQEDIDALLTLDLSEGFSTHMIECRYYRIYRLEYDPALTFWEQDDSYIVSETVSFQNVTAEESMFHSLRLASTCSLAASAILFCLFGYLLARRSLVPIDKAWHKQRQLVADTSHELRNPLAAIQTNAELLLRHPDSTIKRESEYVAAIVDSSSKMANMLATLLTLARADADEDEMTYERVCLSDLLRETSTQFTLIGEGLDIDLSTTIAPELYVLGDSKRLDELFAILLDNAIRYTRAKGMVSVSCSQDRGVITVSIKDTGIGISPDDLDAVFHRFYRSEYAHTINPDGTGLGLPIAQWIVQRHNAEIHVESTEGKGTLVTLTFKSCASES